MCDLVRAPSAPVTFRRRHDDVPVALLRVRGALSGRERRPGQHRTADYYVMNGRPSRDLPDRTARRSRRRAVTHRIVSRPSRRSSRVFRSLETASDVFFLFADA